jgi:cystathionine gamma-synthase
VETLLTQIEGGADARVFASGMAAATAVFQALRPGDHVIVGNVIYYELQKWLQEHATRWGLEVSFVDAGDLDAVAGVVREGRTKLIWAETPSNPMWGITDIVGAAAIAHDAGARLAIDSTCASPILTRPIEHGADIVMHSASKYLNGHSDLIAGALVGAKADDFWERVCQVRLQQGAVLGAFEASQLLRGMRTLSIRVKTACANAQTLAERLADHPAVGAVLYPGLPTHPGHAIANRQMEGGFGGMMSIRVRGGEAAAIATAAGVQVWTRATSLGAVESLIEHRASIETATTRTPRDLLRLSVGIEDVDDLYDDLDQALRAAT